MIDSMSDMEDSLVRNYIYRVRPIPTNLELLYIDHDIIVDYSYIFLSFTQGEQYLIDLYYLNELDITDDKQKSDLITIYSCYPKFINVLNNVDLKDLVDNIDTISDHDIVNCAILYKLMYNLKLLSDVQLKRIVNMCNYNSTFNRTVWDLIDYDNRLHILFPDKIDIYNTPLPDDLNDNIFNYLCDNDKFTDVYIYNYNQLLSDVRFKRFNRNKFITILHNYCVNNINDNDHISDSNLTAAIVYRIQPLTPADLQHIHDHRLWKLHKLFPENKIAICKRYPDNETLGEYIIRLNDTLPKIKDKQQLLPIKNNNNKHISLTSSSLLPPNDTNDQIINNNTNNDDDDNNDVECYITQTPFYPGQQYRICNNGHCVDYFAYRKMQNKICGLCRSHIIDHTYINMSLTQYETLFK